MRSAGGLSWRLAGAIFVIGFLFGFPRGIDLWERALTAFLVAVVAAAGLIAFMVLFSLALDLATRSYRRWEHRIDLDEEEDDPPNDDEISRT